MMNVLEPPSKPTPPLDLPFRPGRYPQLTLINVEQATPKKLPLDIRLRVVFGVLIAILLIGFAFSFGRYGKIPSYYTPYATDDNLISFVAPGGWSVHEKGGKQSAPTFNGVEFTSGDAKIDVVTDHGYNLALPAGVDPVKAMENDLRNGIAGAMHTRYRSILSHYAKYHNDGYPIIRYPSASVDACKSQWTGRTGLFGVALAVHGYRASLVGMGTDCEIVCVCPARQWHQMKPVFETVINSFRIDSPPTIFSYQPSVPIGGMGQADDFSELNTTVNHWQIASPTIAAPLLKSPTTPSAAPISLPVVPPLVKTNLQPTTTNKTQVPLAQPLQAAKSTPAPAVVENRVGWSPDKDGLQNNLRPFVDTPPTDEFSHHQ